MELHNLKFSNSVRFHVEDIEDYNITGTFDPNSASDIEFYGYRETTFTVAGVDSKRSDEELWLPEDEHSVKEFAKYFDNTITLIVQDAIDKHDEEFL